MQYERKSRRPRSQIFTCFIFLVLFQNSCAFIEENNLSEKFITVEEGLGGKDRDDIGNLDDSPTLVCIDDECENLIVVNDGGELVRPVNQTKKLNVLH